MEQHEQAVIQQIMQIVMNKVNQVQNPVKNDSDEELEVKELPQSQKAGLKKMKRRIKTILIVKKMSFMLMRRGSKRLRLEAD